MLSANEIRNVRFSTAMGGYKKEEVDVLLDKVEADYELFERTLREMKSRIEELNQQIEEYKGSQGNIQNILVSAQRFADQIVEEAKTKSAEIIASAQESIEQITAHEQELTTAFDKRAGERKMALESDLETIISNAEQRQGAIEAATQDCVTSQQILFDKTKAAIAAFKADIMARYKAHLELLASLPDSVPTEPTAVAEETAHAFESVPTVEEYIKNPEGFDLGDKQETIAEDPEEVVAKPSTGFVINADGFDIDDEESDDQEEI